MSSDSRMTDEEFEQCMAVLHLAASYTDLVLPDARSNAREAIAAHVADIKHDPGNVL